MMGKQIANCKSVYLQAPSRVKKRSHVALNFQSKKACSCTFQYFNPHLLLSWPLIFPMSTHLNASRNASSPSSSSSSSTPASSSSSSSPHLDSPVAPRPTRSEYASYTAMLRHLDARESGKLSRRLIDSQATLAFDHPPPNDDSTPKRKWQTAKEEISTHWPLAPVDLPRPPVTLENAIISFASSHLRAHRPTSSQPEISLVEGDVTLPPSLVSSTKEFVNQILVGMALMRPVDVARKRRLMRRISWHGVLGAASLTCEDHE